MTNRLITWAKNQTVGDALAKCVLVLIADQASASGVCWPAHKTLSKDSEIPVRTLQRKLDLLVSKGFLSVEARYRPENKGRSSNRSRLLADAEYLRDTDGPDECLPPSPIGVGVSAKLRRGGHAKGGVGYEPTTLTEETSEEVSPRKRDVADAFTRWIAIYPNRIEQRAACQLFDRVLRKRTASVDELIAGAQRYAIEVHGRPSGMIKSPTTWLLQECWLDGEKPQTSEQVAPPPVLAKVLFPGPSEIRATAVAYRGEDWVSAWLDPCGWDEAAGQLIPRTGFAADRIEREIGRELSAAGVKIGRPARAMAGARA